MSRSRYRSRCDALLLIAAALLGTLPVALLASACVARFLPVSPDARYALAFALAVPLWISAMSAVFVARSGARALATCVALSALLAAVVYLTPH